jgi:hypothetical protein
VRQQAVLRFHVQNATRAWLNGNPVCDKNIHLPSGEFETCETEGLLRQGRNVILVKVSTVPGEFRFALDIESSEGKPLEVKWWR